MPELSPGAVAIQQLPRCFVSESDAVVVDILGRMKADEEPALSAFVYVAGAGLQRGEQVAEVYI
jgi:hypothetical protein